MTNTATTAPPLAPADDADMQTAVGLDVTERLALVRGWLADSTSDRAMFAREVIEDAIAEVTYLRGAAFAKARGARPMGDFWASLRKRKR